MKSRLGQKAAVFFCVMLMAVIARPGAVAETPAVPGDGLYTIAVESSSGMFRVVKCVLRVDGGEITATLTLGGTGYGYLYQGTMEQADTAPVEPWSPFVEDQDGRYAYTIQVPALDTDVDVAAWSIRYEKWYGRTLRFLSESLQDYAAIPRDGEYLVDAVSDAPSLDGTQWRLTVAGGGMVARLTQPSGQALEITIPSLERYLPVSSLATGTDDWGDARLLFDALSLRPYAGTASDGIYTARVTTDSNLLVITGCTLTVEDGRIVATMTTTSTNYDYLFAGTGKDARKAEERWIPAAENADGTRTFVSEVPGLDCDVPFATYSPKTNKWYDRTLRFEIIGEAAAEDEPAPDEPALLVEPDSDGATAPVDNVTSLPDGNYMPDAFSFAGGTGRTTLSCEGISVRDGRAFAVIAFSSRHYEYVRANAHIYYGARDNSSSRFEIPIALNAENGIIGMTSAMSADHEIAYTIRADIAAAAVPSDELGLTLESELPLAYAEGFSVNRYADGYSLIDVRDGARYLVVPEDMPAPAGLPLDIAVLQKPLDTIYLAATSAMALFDRLDALDSIRLVGTQADGWYVESAAEAMRRGDMLFAGKYSEPDYELLITQGCDLAIESTMILHAPKTQEMLELLGIPVFIDRSSYEAHPLGRVEWIKLYGAMTGREPQAEALFDAQVDAVRALGSLGGAENTVAWFAVRTDGTVSVPSAEDYVASMIDIAGGTYAFEQLGAGETAHASLSITAEEFYAGAVDADYLIYNAAIDDPLESVADLLAKDALFADFKAVREGNVWCTGRHLYQATDMIGDVIVDIHRMLAGERDGMTFLYRLD
ncbi:ABC transporter substrate-binding protein [Eubacteriales bacterium OttesenSCG-928-A19]|nr:ABC transporter substrate-binding protein [Eubacteriales bacterium OttesenSCG-928-A19]